MIALVLRVVLLSSCSCYLLRLVAAQEAEQHQEVVASSAFFGGVNDAVYTTWLAAEESASSYDRHLFMPAGSSSASTEDTTASNTTTNGAAIHWSIRNDHIYLAVAVRATGWAAFGISENGGMRGADMVIFEAAEEKLTDAHVLEALVPIPDSCQSWTLINFVAEDGFIIFEASRLLDTGDTQDRALFDDSSLLIPANRIVAAWGESPSYSYHGPNRARASIRFFGDDIGDEWELFTKNMEAESEGSFALLANDFEIPATGTTYRDFCFVEGDLVGLGMPENTALHTIGIEPILDERTAQYVHHFVVYGITDPLSCRGVETAYVWAPGDVPMILPTNVGSPLGIGGYRAFVIEVHYNNPSLDSGAIDSSGIRLFWTAQKREHDLGVLQLGDPALFLEGQQVGNGLASHNFACGSECSQLFLPGPITVIREKMHMHISGRRMITRHVRNKEVIRSGAVDYFDFYQQGTLSIVQDAYVVEPGDAFETKCYYDSKNGEQFGYASQEEMCIGFLSYYPRVDTSFTFACAVDYGLPGINQCNATWSKEEELPATDNLDRIFGESPLTCPNTPTGAPITQEIEADTIAPTSPPTQTAGQPTSGGSSPRSNSTSKSILVAATSFAYLAYLSFY